MPSRSGLLRAVSRNVLTFAPETFYAMVRKKLRITKRDYLLANRRASRLEEIQAHGKPVANRTMVHRSKKVYDRNRVKREDRRQS